MTALDLIGAIERAYDRNEDEATWLAGLTRSIAPAFGVAGLPVLSYVFDLEDKDVRVGTTTDSADQYTKEQYQRGHQLTAEKVRVQSVYEGDPFTLLSRVVGPEIAKASLNGAGLPGDDAIGLRANATPTSGVLVMAQSYSGQRLKNRELWTRLAAHLGTALRLRRAKVRLEAASASAILTPGGTIEHGNAETVNERTALGAAAKAIDRARGKLRRLDPEAASALWRTMVRGEWTLVDWYDHDGKRFLLAEENRVPARSKRTLTAREEQVVACAAMGHSNKLIAYDLGLSTGTVAVLLGRAAKKLGVSGRVALVRAYREGR